jgi:hypothetical protein
VASNGCAGSIPAPGTKKTPYLAIDEGFDILWDTKGIQIVIIFINGSGFRKIQLGIKIRPLGPK